MLLSYLSLKIVETTFCGLGAVLLGGVFFRLIDALSRQRKLVAIMTMALQNECSYNSEHGRNEKSHFQTYWLEEALGNLDFYNQCEDIAKKCLKLLELSKNANLAQLEHRKMRSFHIQEKMVSVVSDINEILPKLKKRTHCLGYIFWITKANILRMLM
jgi:hypothetical protein